METPVVTKESSIFNARRSTSLQILCCVLARFHKILDRRMGAKIRMDQVFSKLQKLWQNQWRDDGIRVESSQDATRYSSASKSKLKSKGHGKLSIHFGRPGNDWDHFSDDCLCKPAQSSRNNRKDMWRAWNPSRKNGATCCDGAINRPQCDQDRSFFGKEWPSTSEFEKVLQQEIEQILHGCKNFENCWKWTVFHDEKHWRFDTIQYKGLSWMHSSKRRINITTKRMDPRNTKIGPMLELTTNCLHKKHGVEELCLWAETMLTRGSEFLMDQISLWWISTTTTQKFLKISSKKMRYNWMQKILHANQRQK